MKIISINNIDIQLLYCIFILILFGVVMLYSASSAISNNLFTNDTFFLSKHISRLLIGLFFMFLFLFINYKSLKNIAIYLVIFSFILKIISKIFLNEFEFTINIFKNLDNLYNPIKIRFSRHLINWTAYHFMLNYNTISVRGPIV